MSWLDKILGRENNKEEREQDADSEVMATTMERIAKDKPKPKDKRENVERNRKWREANKDKIKEYEKSRRQNPERKEYMKELHKKRREIIKNEKGDVV